MTEELASECPVCYEELSNDDPSHAPRRLDCNHIVCTTCIVPLIDDGELCCPECFSTQKCAHVESLAAVSVSKSSSGENPETPDHDKEAVVEPMQSNNLSSFLSTMKKPVNKMSSFMSSVSSSKMLEVTETSPDVRATSSDVRVVDEVLGEKKPIPADAANEMAYRLKSTVLIDDLHVRPSQVRRWGDYNPAELALRFSRQQRMQLGEAMALIQQARGILTSEPNIIDLQSDIHVVGDIHGQFFDLLNIVKITNFPTEEGSQLLFLGDYVDRGKFSCEVILYLLALKVTYPKRVWMLRGNHECRRISSYFGFKEECKLKYGMAIYHQFIQCFEALPLCAVIHADYGNVLALHGGISPQIKTLEDIQNLDRFVEPQQSGALCDILWADPIGDGNIGNLDEYQMQEFLRTDWSPNRIRGCSYFFGHDVLLEFLDQNDLVCLIRAHEIQELGFYEHFDIELIQKGMNEKMPNPKYKANMPILKGPVMTVFSAPNYNNGEYSNKGSILFVGSTLRRWKICEFEGVEHPDPLVLPSEFDANLLHMLESCPYMPTTFTEMIKISSELGPPGPMVNDSTPKEQSEDSISSPSKPMKKLPSLTPEQASNKFKRSVRNGGVGGDKISPMPNPRESGNISVKDIRKMFEHKKTKPEDNTNDQRLPEGIKRKSSRRPRPSIEHIIRRRDSSVHNLKHRFEHNKKQQLSFASPQEETRVPNRLSSKIPEEAQISKQRSSESPGGTRSKNLETDLPPASFRPKDKKRRSKTQGRKSDRTRTSEVQFSRQELVSLRLMFSLFDSNGDDVITRNELSEYAEESDYIVQRKELDQIMNAIDADRDGKIGLLDYIIFAARVKEAHALRFSHRGAPLRSPVVSPDR